MSLNSRALLTFHHIFSSKKKEIIRKAAKEISIYGICKIGYPGVLAVEGEEGNIKRYIREIKLLRWQSCTLNDITSGLGPGDLRMSTMSSTPGIVMTDKMSDVGLFMREAGLEEWWRKTMGYSKGPT